LEAGSTCSSITPDRSQAPVADLSREEWQRVFDVNLTGPFLLMKASIPHMIKGAGDPSSILLLWWTPLSVWFSGLLQL